MYKITIILKTCLYISIFLLHNCNIIRCKELLSRYEEIYYNNETVWLITDILYRTVDHSRCLSIILDNFYQSITQDYFSGIFHMKPYFKVIVEDDEDLLSPNYSTLKSLQEMKKNGCDLYLILLSNGEQLARLLTFGDRHRTIDTRANFIFIHDSRLFSKKYFFLWQKIINVIFLRRYRNTIRFELSTVPFPASSTGIVIPHNVDTWRSGSFQKNRILFWDKTINLKQQTLQVVTFEHVPSTVVLSAPSNKSDEVEDVENKIYGGLEIEVLKTLSAAMNFQYGINEPEDADTEQWGKKRLNGSYTGLLGEIHAGRADIALGNLYYSPYHLQIVDLSIPYDTECLTFLTPEYLTDNSWHMLILPFQPKMWLAVILMLFVSAASFYLLALYQRNVEQQGDNLGYSESDSGSNADKEVEDIDKADAIPSYYVIARMQKVWDDIARRLSPVRKKLSIKWDKMNRKKNFMKKHNIASRRRRFLNVRPETRHRLLSIFIDENEEKVEHRGLYLFQHFNNSLLYTYGMLLGVSLPKIPTGWPVRVLTGWWWLYCILVAVAYRASLTAILANPAPRVTIDTLEELAESNIACGGWGEQSKEFFTTSLDRASQQVGRKFEVTPTVDNVVERIEKGSFAYYENIDYLHYLSVKHKSCAIFKNCNETEEELAKKSDIRILHIMRDCVINMPVSIGLQKNSPLKLRMDKYLMRVIEAGLVKKWLNDVMFKTRTTEAQSSKQEIKALVNLSKLYGAVIALLAGCVISVVVLLIECVTWNCIEKRSPSFDMYDLRAYYALKNKK